jgi:hypothetical protein
MIDMDNKIGQIVPKKKILEQLEMLKKGAPFVNLFKPACINNGIKEFSKYEKEKFADIFSKVRKTSKIIKFVPASGAATRMFKVLIYFYNNFDKINENQVKKEEIKGNSDYEFILDFIKGIKSKKFSFYYELEKLLARDNICIDTLIKHGEYKSVLEYLLKSKGLNYENLPKALLKFHKYKDCSRTSMEEHIVEGIEYARGTNNIVCIEFAVSPEFKQKVKDFLEEILPIYKKENIKFEITISEQEPSTNTIALDEKGGLLKDCNNNLVLRPGGHGALINNLNNIEGDIIFIKNIDNVVHDHLKTDTFVYKRALCGYLFQVQAKVFDYLKKLYNKNVSKKYIDEISFFSEHELNIFFPEKFKMWEKEKKEDFLFKKLNRPIRVCGMVKNEGKPGGGPFWVKDKDNSISLQIVENAQIDFISKEQKDIVACSTHFNPVDIICGIRDFMGNKFNFNDYVNPGTYFISTRSKDGESIKILELPGLWNGAMSDWITIFVQVPLITFNPVKTVNDLLKKEHQPAQNYEPVNT